MFPHTRIVVTNREPYAQIASAAGRVHSLHQTTSPTIRTAVLTELAGLWLARSYLLRNAIETDSLPFLSYEDFCEAPSTLAGSFALDHFRYRDDVDIDGVKDYPPQPVHNQNARQIGGLSTLDVQVISRSLRGHTDLLSFFGYALRT